MLNKRELSEKKELHKKKEGFEVLLHTLPVGVSILGKDGRPLYANAALKSILKLTHTELTEGKYRQRQYLRADGSEMPPEEFPSARALREGKTIHDVEIGIITEKGEEIWTTVSATPFEFEDWHIVLTTTEITRQKEFELALQQKTADLTERIKELNCLYGIAALVEQPGITLEKIFQGTANLIPAAWHYPEATCARIIYNGDEYLSANFNQSKWQQSEAIRTHGKNSGSVEVFINKDLGANQNPFLKEEENLIYAIAERLGRITERFKAEQLLNELATTDPLTGIYNRRHYFEVASHEIARAKRYEHWLTCIMIDIDYFKRINDQYGHVFGDKVLQAIVKHCQRNIRQVDIFARYGGDEFIMLLPDTDLQRSVEIAHRICCTANKESLYIDGEEIDISLSLGIASMHGAENLTLDNLLNHADEALYTAKKNGRGQLAIWQENA